MAKIQSRDSAVSPVIGVMLMLVVCIIIAAVVSGFAGGLAGGTDKAPQIALGAKIYNGTSITLIHQGGDPLAWENIEFRTFIPSGTFKDMSYVTNLTNGIYLPTGNQIGVTNAWGTTYESPFKPGDEATFSWEDCFAEDYFKVPGGSSPNQGEQVTLQIFDKVSGKMIVSKTATVI